MIRVTITFTILLSGLQGCQGNQGNQDKPALSKLNRFFENARRRDADQSEKSYIGKIENCTGFFVRNSKNLNLFMTARHCMQFDAAKWCASNHVVTDEISKETYRCSKVAAQVNSADTVLLELNGTRKGGSLRLAKFLAAAGTPIKMVGYPGDLMALGKPTTTENCWIQDAISPNPYPNHAFLRDLTYSHNCSTYGGNSGGPMIIEGTDIAVGQPYSYEPADYKKYVFYENLLNGAAIFNLTSPRKDTLAALGVELVANQPAFEMGNYFPTARYKTDDTERFPCGLMVVPIYRSAKDLKSMKVFDGCTATFLNEFTCTSDASTCEVEGNTIKTITNGAFIYSTADAHDYPFRREDQ